MAWKVNYTYMYVHVVSTAYILVSLLEIIFCSVSSAVGSEARQSRVAIEHNIPHRYIHTFYVVCIITGQCMIAVVVVDYRFVLKSAPLHKSYTCSFCKSSIKAVQKFVKCSCK